MTELFTLPELFQIKFNNGFIELARDKNLSTFILAMANATVDENIYAK
jgi:hypothetical protein